jgi:Protein of unknown function with HXXEE motif
MGFKFDRWAMAWLTLSSVLGLHVVEEAVDGSFALYNDMVDWLGVIFPFIELPAFRYNVWVVNLSGTVLVLVALTGLVALRQGPMRLASYALALFAVANAALHILMSLSAERLLPGTLSSPLVLAAALFLLVSIPESSAERDSRTVAG